MPTIKQVISLYEEVTCSLGRARVIAVIMI